MRLSSFFKGALVVVSHQSIKRVINGYPKPIRKIIVSCIRLTVFLCIFLFLYSFLSSRIYSIAGHDHAPGVLSNIFIGIIFVISIVVSFILTAVIEDIYSIPSRAKQTAKDGFDGVKEGTKEGVKVSTNVVKKSIKSTKETLGKVGHVTAEGASKIYKNSMTATSAVAGPVGSWISSKIAARKKKGKSKTEVKKDDSASDKKTLESLKDISESE